MVPTYRTRVYAFLHLSATGLAINRIMPELADITFAQVEEAARSATENRGFVLGIKVRIAHGATGQGDQANAREALRRGRQAAELAGLPLMVHVSDTPIPLDEILDQLRPGDIATHIFNGNAEQVIGADGRVRTAVRAARERGVVLDVGHATIHCDVNVSRRAIGEGLLPTTLSTDLHTPPPGRHVYNLRGVMSKFLALGMPLDEVVASVTSRAAAAIGKSSELGSLAPGMVGDALIADLEDGLFTYRDGAGNEIKAARRFRTRHVVREGRRLPAAHADVHAAVGALSGDEREQGPREAGIERALLPSSSRVARADLTRSRSARSAFRRATSWGFGSISIARDRFEIRRSRSTACSVSPARRRAFSAGSAACRSISACITAVRLAGEKRS